MELVKHNLDKLVYIDESGIDKFISREYGWGLKGNKVIGEVSGRHYARESFISRPTSKQNRSAFLLYRNMRPYFV